MSILLRSAILTKINNWITTNGNKEITGAQLNEILTDMVDSGFLQLDEIRTALSILYQNVGNPADWDGGVAPATQNLVNDQLADRMKFLETNNYSQNVAYFGPTGSDTLGEFELGNPAKPFLTFQAAVDAVPSARGRVICLGGTFTETEVLIQKSQFYLEFKNSTFNGQIWVKDSLDFEADFGGSIIQNSVDSPLFVSGTGGELKRFRGGEFVCSLAGGVAVSGGNISMENARIRATGTSYAVSCAVSRFSNCNISTESQTTVFRCRNNIFYDCIMQATISKGVYNTQEFNSFYNCVMISATANVGGGESTVGLRGKFVGCTMRAGGLAVLNFNGSDQDVEVRNCKLVGAENCVNFAVAPKPANQRYLFKENTMIAGTGEIYNDSTATLGGTWELLSINNSQNKAKNMTTPTYVKEHNVYVDANIPDVPDL